MALSADQMKLFNVLHHLESTFCGNKATAHKPLGTPPLRRASKTGGDAQLSSVRHPGGLRGARGSG